MKLITLNIWQGRLFRNYPKFIQEQNADILCFQEVYTAEEDVPYFQQFNSAKELVDASALAYSYESPLHKFEVMGVPVTQINLLMSRYPIIKKETVFTNGEYNEASNTSEFVKNVRNAQIVELDVNGKSITVVNHHALWDKDPEGTEASLDNIKILEEALKPINGPLIVVGDFNLRSSSKAMTHFKQALGLTNLTEELNIKSTLSSEVTPFIVDCDQILIRGGVKKNSYKVYDELLSDHRAVGLEFDV